MLTRREKRRAPNGSCAQIYMLFCDIRIYVYIYNAETRTIYFGSIHNTRYTDCGTEPKAKPFDTRSEPTFPKTCIIVAFLLFRRLRNPKANAIPFSSGLRIKSFSPFCTMHACVPRNASPCRHRTETPRGPRVFGLYTATGADTSWYQVVLCESSDE